MDKLPLGLWVAWIETYAEPPRRFVHTPYLPKTLIQLLPGIALQPMDHAETANGPHH